MYLTGAAGQQTRHPKFDASGTITTGGTPQLLLPEAKSRAFLLIINQSSASLYLDFGSARATASLAGGAVTGTTITNGGFGFTYPPDVFFYGGGNSGVGGVLGVGQWGYPAPGDPAWSAPPGDYGRGGGRVDLSGQRQAKGHAVLTANAVSSIVIDDPGAGYQVAPMVFMANSLRDPFGCANPGQNSATSFFGAITIVASGNYYVNGTTCPTDAIAIYGATTGQAFTCKWMP
jgi:hypothetical protein